MIREFCVSRLLLRVTPFISENQVNSVLPVLSDQTQAAQVQMQSMKAKARPAGRAAGVGCGPCFRSAEGLWAPFFFGEMVLICSRSKFR